MNIGRKIEALTAMASAVAAAFVLLAACGGSSPAPAASPSPKPTATALSLTGACQALRADILANGGSPGPAVLHRIIGQSTNSKLASDAQLALDDIGKSEIAMGIILGSLDYDCRSTGVTIPQG